MVGFPVVGACDAHSGTLFPLYAYFRLHFQLHCVALTPVRGVLEVVRELGAVVSYRLIDLLLGEVTMAFVIPNDARGAAFGTANRGVAHRGTTATASISTR